MVEKEALLPIVQMSFGSSIILTTITDVIGFFAFLSFAVLFQQFLV
jgi:Mg/Co/Ni transporter MgtE